MQNELFELTWNLENGGVEGIVLTEDTAYMNWICETWGIPKDMEVLSVECTEAGCKAEYTNKGLKLTVDRFFDENGWVQENYMLENLLDFDYFLKRGEVGIKVPFADVYDNAEYCMTNRCHAHVWCGGSTTYVKALKMGLSEKNLGLVLTEGSIDCYSILRDDKYLSNRRGVFVFHPSAMRLAPHQKVKISWKLFPHKGTEDFYRILEEKTDSIVVKADHYTVFQGEAIHFTCNKTLEAVTHDGAELPMVQTGKGVEVTLLTEKLGEHILTLHYRSGVGNVTEAKHLKKTVLRFFVSLPLWELAGRRVRFIAQKQQCQIEDSALYGAYLVYDNKEETQFFDALWHDLNACRERVGMAILMAKYLQKRPDQELMDSLLKFDRFLRREYLDERIGQVFNDIGRKNNRKIRLYNYPWVMMYFMETYKLTKEQERLEILARVIDHYYEMGGVKHYALALSLLEIVRTMEEGGREDLSGKVMVYYEKHVERMMQNGLNYPAHEVNYEQTIVSPATTLITEYCNCVDTEKNREAAREQLNILERFNGQQPDYRLHETSIRHWDGYWFGKNRLFGDTFPHYWSSVTGWAFCQYAKLTGDAVFRKRGEDNLRACLCTFFDDGKASCAYLYPFMINESKGEYFDDYANDQDFALYYALKVL